MLHEHQFFSYFPQYDRLEQILGGWPTLFTQPPTPTQPVHVEDGTAIVLCQNAQWAAFIREHEQELVARLQPLVDTDVDLDLRGIEAVVTTPNAIYIARQIIAVLARLRDLGVKF
jgi:hypothetical protein